MIPQKLVTSGIGKKGSSMHRPIASLLMRVTSFRGRVGRGDFWAVFLLAAAVSVVLCVHPAPVTSGAAIQVKRFFFAILLLQVISPIILASYTSRRLHDLDKPGWWTIPFLGALLALAVIWTPAGQSALKLLAGGGALEAVSYVLTTAAAGIVAAFLCLLSSKGSAGPNKHGRPAGDFDLPYLLTV
jgi:uncharacterized membrane protein YhaH (DUF805 family)